MVILFQVGDLVILKNDKKPYIYRIDEIIKKDVISYHLIGYSYRMNCYVTADEIIKATDKQIKSEDDKNDDYLKRIKKSTSERNNRSVLFGRILHLDGDLKFLESCLNLYKDLKIPAEGLFIPENKLTKQIENLIMKLTPDIIVVTGHDSYNKQGIRDLNNYENSRNFIETVRIIRKHFNIDSVVVIAGACASHFEAIIASGANFASSPDRINTHTYDPAIVAIKVATTGFNRIVDFNHILKHIENGRGAIGGVETYGKMRLLL